MDDREFEKIYDLLREINHNLEKDFEKMNHNLEKIAENIQRLQ